MIGVGRGRGRNLHAYPAAMRHESRILKGTRSIAEAGLFDKVLIAAREAPARAGREKLAAGREIWRLPVRSRNKLLRHIEWMARVYLKFRRETIACVNCHSLSVLPLGVLFKRFHGARLVYDAHELETETAVMRGARRAISRLVERWLIGDVDRVIVVSESIARWYRERYGIDNVSVVRNIPEPGPNGDGVGLKQRLGLPRDALLFLYQGLLDDGRGIRLLVRAFAGGDPSRHVVFMGHGALERTVRDEAARHPNIHFHESVAPHDVVAAARGADVGLALIEDVCLSYRLCLPNKLFEYVAAGLPVIVSDFPDMGAFVDANGCGWRTTADAAAVRALVSRLTVAEIRERAARAESAARALRWSDEAANLLAAVSPP